MLPVVPWEVSLNRFPWNPRGKKNQARIAPSPILTRRSGLASPDLRRTKLRFAERIMRLRLGPRPSRRIAYAMLLGEGLAARSAGFGLDRVN